MSACAAHFMEKFGTWDKAEAGADKEQAVIYVTGGSSGARRNTEHEKAPQTCVCGASR